MADSLEQVRAWTRQLAGEVPADRLAAAQALVRSGESAQPAAVALVRAAGDADSEIAALAHEALENLGPPDMSDLFELACLLVDGKADSAYWAATLIGRLGPDGAGAVDILVRAVESHPEMPVRERAVWALGRIGPAAGSARQVLEASSRCDSPRLARLAREALEAIGAR